MATHKMLSLNEMLNLGNQVADWFPVYWHESKGAYGKPSDMSKVFIGDISNIRIELHKQGFFRSHYWINAFFEEQKIGESEGYKTFFAYDLIDGNPNESFISFHNRIKLESESVKPLYEKVANEYKKRESQKLALLKEQQILKTEQLRELGLEKAKALILR